MRANGEKKLEDKLQEIIDDIMRVEQVFKYEDTLSFYKYGRLINVNIINDNIIFQVVNVDVNIDLDSLPSSSIGVFLYNGNVYYDDATYTIYNGDYSKNKILLPVDYYKYKINKAMLIKENSLPHEIIRDILFEIDYDYDTHHDIEYQSSFDWF